MTDELTVSSGDLGDITALDYDSLHDVFLSAYMDAYALQMDVSDGQTISNTALTYFEGILGNKWLPTDYVCWVGSPYYYYQNNYQREGYEYVMAYGNDLELAGNTFSGKADVCTIRLYPAPSVTYQKNVDISLNAPVYYSRSNLGDYSGIIDYDWTGFGVLFCLMLGGVTWFVNSLFRRSPLLDWLSRCGVVPRKL